MEDNNFPLSELSTKEEVAEYMCSKNNLKDDVKNILLNEYISGDVLPELSIKDMEELKIKLGPRKRIEKFISENKSNFKEKEITEKIMLNSNAEEVKAFFKNSLEFTGELNGLDGKGLLELTEEGMKELGLKFGQRKRLIKYIEYFKTLKPPEEEEILISRQSSEEEVANFLKMRLKFSQDSIKNIELDGETLFDLKEEDVDRLKEITEEEKENLKKFIRGEFDKAQEIIKLDLHSSLEDICNFLKKKLNFSDEAIESIKEQDLDAETFFSLSEEDINKIDGISELEKEKLNIYLTEYRKEQEGNVKEGDKEENIDKNSKEKSNSPEKPPKKEKDEPKIDLNINKAPTDSKANLAREIIIEKDKHISEEEEDKKDNKINQGPEDNKRNTHKKAEKKKEEKESKKEGIKKDKEEIIKNNLKKDVKSPKKNIDNNEDKHQEPKIRRANKAQDALNKTKKNIPNSKTTNIKNEKIEDEKPNTIRKNVKDEDEKNKREKKDGKMINRQIAEYHIIKEEKSNFIKFSPLKKFTIDILKNAPSNVFFFITMTEKQENSAEISIYREENAIFNNSTYYILNCYLIYKQKHKDDSGGLNFFYLFQVPLEKQIKKLTLSIKKGKKEQYNSSIYTNNIENYFQVNSLRYDAYENFPIVDENTIFTEYLDFFWNQNDFYGEKLQKCLTKGLIHKLGTEYNIKLVSYNFLRILKLCSKFDVEVKIMDYTEIKIVKMDPRYYITDEDIDKINSKKKPKIIELIMKIFLDIDDNYLMKLIKGKNGLNICRCILDSFNRGLNLNNFIKNISDEDFVIFQNVLVSVAKSINETEYIINMKKGLMSSLNYIKENIDFLLTMDNKLFPINLNFPIDNDNIDEIYILVNEIMNKIQDKKRKIINLVHLFTNLLNFTYYKDLKELCKLHNFVKFIPKERKLINTLYQKIHEKGMTLIINNQLSTEDIFTFIMTQDCYYCDPIYNTSEYRDPDIFKFIPITKRNEDDKEYLKNIGIIRENRLFELFSAQSDRVQRRFQGILLEQMKTMTDLKSIFDIFPHKFIDQRFTFLINGIVDKLKYTLLDEAHEKNKILFDIFDEWLLINIDNRLDLNYCCGILEINYDFTSKYYFHIFKSENLKIVDRIRGNIINFFLGQNNQNNSSPESLIILLENIKNAQFCKYVLDQMSKFIMTEEDFYQNEENERYRLFKLFLEKCRDLYKNPYLADVRYLNETSIIQNKIIHDITHHNIRYELINNLIDEQEFAQKIKCLFTNERVKVNDIFNSLKKDIEICRQRFDELEKINDYLNSFFNMTKFKEIELINKFLIIYKQKQVSEIINKDNFFEEEEYFNFEELLEESKNLKYKDSCFFMAIYNSKKNNEGYEKSEDKIFFDSIEDYKNTIKEIINQRESKQPFFEINYVMQIIKEIQNPSNDLKKEIEFILEEFTDLGKDNYINNNLLNDLINFSNKEKISKLIQSIIYFIETFNKIKKIEKTNFLESFEQAFNTINSSEVSGDEIKEAIELLKKNDYDIKKETGLTKFYELLLGKEEAITFIKTIKDRNLDIRNLNEFIDESETSELQTSDIDNLLNVYSFFEKMMENKNIKTDENLLKIFKSQFLKEKNIDINIQNYLNSYGEIIQLYESYGENPEMTKQKIESLLEQSTLYLYKDKKNDLFTFKLEYNNNKNIKVESSENQLEELRNKILLTSTSLNNNEENNDKSELTKKYIKLIENLTKLTKTLNSLLKAGYPDLNEFTLKIRKSEAYDEKDN